MTPSFNLFIERPLYIYWNAVYPVVSKKTSPTFLTVTWKPITRFW